MHYDALQDTLLLLSLAVAAVVLFRRLNLPAILGYLFIGVIAGPYALGWIHGDETTTLLGEIGVVFLLFTIGLEFSIPKFIEMRHALLGLGGTQVLLGTLSGMAIAMLIGIDWQAALIIGGALSLSSTAIVIKQLSDQLELTQEHGRIAVSILLFQDIAAIPFLVMIPIFAVGGGQDITMPLLYALLKGCCAVLVMLALGRWALRPLFHEVARARSAELFTLTALLVALATAWVTGLLGLSLALGAFIAGMMLGETEYRHQIESEIKPFRDVLLGLFFITVGLQLNFQALADIWPWVLLLVLGVVVGKGATIALLTKVSGYSLSTSVRGGIALGQGGEFGIALLALALLTGLINTVDIQPILAAIIISMAIAPLLIRYGDKLLNKLQTTNTETDTNYQPIADANASLSEHVIICGFGGTGEHIARFLGEQNIRYAGLDVDAKITSRAWHEGKPIFYGNAADINMLESLALQHAAAVVISFSDAQASEGIIRYIRGAGYNLPIIVRAHGQEELEALIAAGATEAVPEDLETSLMLATQLLILLNVPIDDVLNRMGEIKRDQYRLLGETK